MTRPKIMLQEWLGKEQTLKNEFLKQELDELNYHGLLKTQLNHNGINCITDRLGNNPYTQRVMLNNTTQLEVSEFCFNKLKEKYRTFKKNKKDSNLLKKQYKFSKETINSIKKLKIDKNLTREENVIENLINLYLNNKTIQQNTVKLQTKPIKLDILNLEIDKNLQKIYELELQNKYLRDEIKKIKSLLALSYLRNDHLKDIIQDNGLDASHPKPSNEMIERKIFEITDLLKESL
ncbi:hypothetical protein HLH10_01610 [Acinetobacter sp. ANC 4277]|uniref:hypothetical protein n=1 Tax=Acinetobacter terrae TaxID=2731247 RepID=UPI00148FACB9|nr:hypothetical protein [Acinetobacter terrae]NNG75033.1 hypothetical protein [Acinetobacter terrae]